MSDTAKHRSHNNHEQDGAEKNERRDFLKTVGKAALITPPAMAILLSTSLDSQAIAGSSGRPHKPSKPHHKPHMKKISFVFRFLKHFFRV